MSKSKTKNITLSIPEVYYDKYDAISDKKKLSKSELLRRWIDADYEEVSDSPL